MSIRHARRTGFTLIELLTVIAIIAILVAILFPVFAAVRRSAQKSACGANMRQIVQALKLYKEQYEYYPRALYGYRFNGVEQQTLSAVYLRDKASFTCPLSRFRTNDTTWTDAAVNYAGAPCPRTAQMVNNVCVPVEVPRFSSYDVQTVPNVDGNTNFEAHYQTKWTATVPVDPMGVTGPWSDNPRQLAWRRPPDETVVTWCLYHATWTGSGPQRGEMAQVLFLGGQVQSIPVERMLDWTNGAWQTQPK